MHKLWVFSFLVILGSCNLFTSKEEKVQELVDIQMQDINWNDVDTYPMFANCDENSEKAIQKGCFEATFLKHFSSALEGTDFIKEATNGGSMVLHFSVDNAGTITVLSIEKDSVMEAQFPEFMERIAKILTEIPELKPAVKQAIPVRVKFTLPITLNTSEN